MIGGVELMEMKGAAMDNKRISEIVDEEMIKQDANRYRDMRKTLRLPKSIAEKIDKFIKVLHFLNEFEAIKFLSGMDLNGDRTPQWFKDNPMLIFVYLAGKALGVDLVKVVEG